MSQTAPALGPDLRGYLAGLVKRIVDECPRRFPTSPDERRAQEIVGAELARLGLTTSFEPFRFNASLYTNLALHCGVALAAALLSVWAPLPALGLHLLVAASLFLDSTRRANVLRRLLPFRPSQNLVATLPAKGEPSLRVVLVAHADAAYTGAIFSPRLAPSFARAKLPLGLERTFVVSLASVGVLALLDLLAIALGPVAAWFPALVALASVPSLFGLVVNLDVMLRNTVVAGACDDLSGVAALPVLAQRLAAQKPDDVELVFVASGCEEASMGGAVAMARARRGVWDPRRTAFVVLDSISNGTLRYFEEEGDIVPVSVTGWLLECIRAVAAADPRFAAARPFRPPLGGTDAHAFLALGWDACAVICVDESVGTPGHYHQVTDTPENLDYSRLEEAIDFSEALVKRIIAARRAS